MKKLLFIILTLLFTNELFASSKCYTLAERTGYFETLKESKCTSPIFNLYNHTYKCYYVSEKSCATGEKPITSWEFTECLYATGPCGIITFDGFLGNPQPGLKEPRCDEGFIKDGKYYNCNPNTNESEFVENSDGFVEEVDEDGEKYYSPKCSPGYSLHNIQRLSSPGSYSPINNQMYCLKNSNDDPSKWAGQTPIDTSNSSGSYYTPNNGKDYSWKDNQGNSYNYTPSTGVLITKDAITGSMNAHAVGSSFQPGDSFTPNGLGYAPNPDGSYGNGGTGGGDTGTGGETPPIDETPATCDDSALNLQEKMLCEMNKGIKKLNSESTPSNSLNQLMKDLNNKSTQLNDSLDTVKNNTNVTNQNLNITNTKLDNLNTSTNTTNSKLDSLNTSTNATNNYLSKMTSHLENNASYNKDANDKLGQLNSYTNTTNTKLDNLNTTLNKLDSTLKDIEKNTKPNNDPDGENGEGQVIDIDSINNKGDSISSGIDALFDIYSTFSSNIQNQFSNIKTQIQDTQNLIIEPSNIFNKTEVSSCPTSYTIDFSSFGIPNKTITIDFCEYTSTLKPLIYLFVYVVLMLGLISLAIRFIGVII